jgi:hypothetical protein
VSCPCAARLTHANNVAVFAHRTHFLPMESWMDGAGEGRQEEKSERWIEH